MKIKELLFILLLGTTITNCSGCGSSDHDDKEDYSESLMVDNELEDYGPQENVINNSQNEIRLTGTIETCNKCMGYGMVQNGLYGQPEICKFCWVSTNMRIQQGWMGFDGRYGQVDAVFNRLPANFFDNLNWNADEDESSDNDGQHQRQTELEIEQHEKNIEVIESQLEYIEGSVNRAYLEQQLIEERYEISRLQNILNNMN